MKKHALSSHQRRTAAHHLKHYGAIMAKPQRGVITYGGGLNISQAISDAEAKGFHCTMTPSGVVLR